jgi:hypothetical protein
MAWFTVSLNIQLKKRGCQCTPTTPRPGTPHCLLNPCPHTSPIADKHLHPTRSSLLRSGSSVAIERFLIERPASRLVQYSYLPWEPLDLRFGASLHWRRLELVWRNVPPALDL